MKALKYFNRLVSLLIIVLLAMPLPGLAQDGGDTAPSASFTKEQLAQMLAPIALYPDTLLSQILMASTYPLEVVEAERWVGKNGDLKGDALDQALLDKDWDPGVKSLCHFPSILAAMSEKIVQTTRLGDAFLAQQDDVMDMVQELRAKAREQGNLESTAEQKVVVEKETIIIESASPEVIYVPSYDPFYAYGPWWYPAYPPYYWWPWPVIYGPGISFWPGIFVGVSVGYWSYFDWHNHYIHIDWHKAHNFHHHRGDGDGRDRWRHDAEHRRGVAYRNRDTARKFGQAPERSREARRDLRGFPERRTMDRQTRELGQRNVDRNQPASGQVDRAGKDRVIDRREGKIKQQRENVFGGSGDVRRERLESERGRSSRKNINRGGREGAGGSRSMNKSQGSGSRGSSSHGSSSQSSRGQSTGRSGGGNSGRIGK